MLKIILSFIVLFFISHSVHSEDFKNCTSCHKVEKIDSVHKMSCIECHVLPQNRKNIYSHKVIIKNPSSFKYVNTLCAKCHKNEIENIQNSLHGTLSSAINITRFAWHAQDTPQPIYAIKKNKNLKAIPLSKKFIKKPSDLADDLLRRKCLRCHLMQNNYTTTGTHRSTGCATCHMQYEPNGRYTGNDIVIFNKFGYSKIHKMYKHPKISSCLSCHNNEFVGTDYAGMFPKDYNKSFRSPILKSGYFKPRIYGIGQHHLISDIHYRKGLTCIDCHKKNDVMGNGKIYENELKAIKVKCSSCHGSYNKKPSPNFIKIRDKQCIFTSSKGIEYKVKTYNKSSIAHKYHRNVACSACHAAWQTENYQLNLYLDETKNYKMWKNLTNQEDPYLEQFLKEALKNGNRKPLMPDYITNKLKNGVWYSGWLARRWSYFTLAKSDDGLYRILRPIFQYRLTYKNENGKIVFNDIDNMSVSIPYSPHTITLYGKSCESCHNNKLIMNGNYFNNTSIENFIENQILFGKKLSKKDIKKLQSKKYRKIRAEMLKKLLINDAK
jgi:hypothetical protein